jgi:hypothetical protein
MSIGGPEFSWNSENKRVSTARRGHATSFLVRNLTIVPEADALPPNPEELQNLIDSIHEPYPRGKKRHSTLGKKL